MKKTLPVVFGVKSSFDKNDISFVLYLFFSFACFQYDMVETSSKIEKRTIQSKPSLKHPTLMKNI